MTPKGKTQFKMSRPPSPGLTGVAPPVGRNPLASPTPKKIDEFGPNSLRWGDQTSPENKNEKPTCSLNLVCYRSGGRGCEFHQIQTAKRSLFESEDKFRTALAENPELITTDTEFFQALRDVYLGKMSGFWRRAFFLKTLKGIRLLSVSKASKATWSHL